MGFSEEDVKNDDVIRREDTLEVLKDVFEEFHVPWQSCFGNAVKEVIQELPSDNPRKMILRFYEKVKTRRDWYDINAQPKNSRDISEICDIREEKGKWLAYNDVLELIGESRCKN